MNEQPDLVLAALAWLQRGHPERALSTLSRVDADALEDPTTWFIRLASLVELERWEEAERAAQAALSRFPDDVSLVELAASVARHQGQAGKAEALLLHGLRTRPEHVGLLCAYAELVAADGQLSKADALISRAAALRPEADRVAQARWVIANLRGDDAQARTIATERAGRRPGDAHALTAMAIEELHAGEVKRAGTLYGAALDADLALHNQAIAEELRVRRHPLWWGMWPIERWGPVRVTFAGVILAQVAAYMLPPMWVLPVLGVWIVYCAYTWIAPPLLRRALRSIPSRS